MAEETDIEDYSKSILHISDEIDKITKGEKYKEGFYKDDDVTIKSDIKEKDVEDLMNIVESHVKHLVKIKKKIEEQVISVTQEEIDKTELYRGKGEEFYLKGSTNFMTGFQSPRFYVEGMTLFFDVKPIDGEVDLVEITKVSPDGTKNTKVAGGVINDGIIVKVPIELDNVSKIKAGTKYTVLLTSTNKQMKATFNYTHKG